MGGCRCSYRNCTVKSDGKTHMFHYPVFEKGRCHQWLINAHRLDFLDLKVSQLKNRVICQHHFRDENFMNFKKDKLTFDAIPTEDGPYCDRSKYTDINQDPSRLYCIIVDDVENEYLNGCDRKANFSMKYGDFLANLDLMDIERTEADNITYNHQTISLDILPPNEDNDRDKFINDDDSLIFKSSLPDKSEKQMPTHTQHILVLNSSNIDQSDAVKCIRRCNNDNVSLNISLDNMLTSNEIGKNETSQQSILKKQSKIKIISEKKITDPVPISGKFEPVSPNFVINVSKIRKDKAKNVISEMDSVEEYKDPVEPSVRDVSKTVEIKIEPLIKEEEKSQASPLANSVKDAAFERPTKVSISKPRVPPERVEAINKKRKFNMKLRDIIETCLDKLENNEKSMEDISLLENNRIKKNGNPTKSLPKKASVLNNQEYAISFLEARIRKMEKTLLEKIDQNSKKIVDLKNTYMKSSENKPVLLSKTDELLHKKHLFGEISKYLSPTTKSLVYEELFINRYALGDTNILSKGKRRKCVT